VTTRNVLIALVGATVVIGTAACGTASPSKPGPASETVTTPPATSVASTPAPSTTTVTVAPSACSGLGGTLGADQLCTVHAKTANYTIDITFPTDYPDQQALSDLVVRERDQFVQYVTAPGLPPSRPTEIDITPMSYRSDGTESVVLKEHADYGGAHGVTFYNALNYDTATKAPLTFDMVFKPGADATLDPILKAAFEQRLQGLSMDDNLGGAKTYQNFALTDDAVIFFIDQGAWAISAAGPQEFSIPRSELASILA
jgi:hypothetical protein